MKIIRHWKTRTRLTYTETDGRIILTNHTGNVMFDGTKLLFDACVVRGWFEIEEAE